MGELDCALGAGYCGDLVDDSVIQTLGLAQQLRQLRNSQQAFALFRQNFSAISLRCHTIVATKVNVIGYGSGGMLRRHTKDKEFALNLKAHFTPKFWIVTLL